MRPPSEGPAQALIVGVYPSAFHISWSPPPELDTRGLSERKSPYSGSLAVDVEPVVFWDGKTPEPADELEAWKAAVGFDEECHGRVGLGRNGPSGARLVEEFLKPLGVEPARAAFTDAVPWFFVKSGPKSQGEAMKRFNALAERLGVPTGSLRPRPSLRELVEIAASPVRRDSLRREVLEADAPRVITLGQEALDAIKVVTDHVDGVQERLEPDGYGRVGRLTIDDRDFDLMPLVHPGFAGKVAAAYQKYGEWHHALKRWQPQ